jgi:hypothetical protein
VEYKGRNIRAGQAPKAAYWRTYGGLLLNGGVADIATAGLVVGTVLEAVAPPGLLDAVAARRTEQVTARAGLTGTAAELEED